MTRSEYTTTIRMHHTDSAGVIFYANLFLLAHDCFEHRLARHIALSGLIDRGIHIPVVHAEADYQKPMRLSEEISIAISVAKKSKRSFTLEYIFKNANGDQTARAQTVHAVIDSQAHKPVEIPPFLQDALSSL